MTMGIVGMGGIGQAMAMRAYYGFNMRILGTDAKPLAKPIFVDTLREPAWFMEMVPQVDILVSAAPSTKETEAMFNDKVFRAMKKTAYFINLSRGALVDENALAQALKEGWIAGAGLDPARAEPLPSSHPALGLPEPDHHLPQRRIRAATPDPSDRAAGRQRPALHQRPAADERGGQTARLLNREEILIKRLVDIRPMWRWCPSNDGPRDSDETCIFVSPDSVGRRCAAQQGWNAHEGGLLKYRVMIRFGEEPDTLPDGWRFGRVSAVAVDSGGNVYVAQRGPRADPIVVFDASGQVYPFLGQRSVQHPARVEGRPEWPCVDHGYRLSPGDGVH